MQEVPEDERWDAVRDRLVAGRRGGCDAGQRRRRARHRRAAVKTPATSIHSPARSAGWWRLRFAAADRRLRAVRAQYRRLQKALPGVDLHYALKPLPHPAVVRTIVGAGGYLDLATTGEVQLVSRLGVTPRAASTRIRSSATRTSATRWTPASRSSSPTIPTKCASSAVTATRPACCCAFRSAVPARSATCRASSAAIRRPRWNWRGWPRSSGIDVRGYSFHVGSQAPDPLKHVEAIEACVALLRQARREKLGSCDTLDIGGGFPVDYAKRVPDIGRFCAPIRKALTAVPRACA